MNNQTQLTDLAICIEEIKSLQSKLKAQQELIEKLERENKIMKDALTIYADDKRYDRDGCLILEVDENLGEISDEGFTAREALAKMEERCVIN